MLINKVKASIFLIIFSGFFSSLIGGYKLGPFNIHFYLVFINLLIFFIFFCHVNNFKKIILILPFFFLIFLNLFMSNGMYGYLQTIYILSPLVLFLIGTSINFESYFENYFKKCLSVAVRLIFLSYIIHELTGLTQISTRWASVYVAIIVILNLILNKNKKDVIFSILSLIFLFASGSRGVSVALLFSILFTYILFNFKKRYSFIVMGFTIFLFFYGYEWILKNLFKMDFLRERTFYDGIYDIDKIKNLEFNSSGRDIAWPIYWDEINNTTNIISIVFGRGSGAIHDFGIQNLGESWAHPHNEVIRIVFDYGVYGLLIFLIFWIYVLIMILRSCLDIYLKKIAFACSVFLFIIMLTDNPLLYPLYFGNIVLFLMGYLYSKSVSRV